MKHRIPSSLRPLFWDVDPNKLDVKRDADFIVARILEWTTLEGWKWLEENYSSKTILAVNQQSRKISQKSKNFWNIWYGTAA